MKNILSAIVAVLCILSISPEMLKAQDEGINWASYLGGKGEETASAMAVHGDFIYIAGFTSSKGENALSSPGAFQYENKGGLDAFIAKIDLSGKLIWSTYFGGIGDDRAYDISYNEYNDLVIIAGATNSADLPADTDEGQNTYAGFGDGFLAAFNTEGGFEWCSYLGGYGNDFINSITLHENSIYAAGYTTSQDFKVSGGAYQKELAGGKDGFIVEIDARDAKFEWGSYYGFQSNDEIKALTFNNGFLYLTGITSSENGFGKNPKNPTSYAGGNSDAFITKFEAGGSPAWANYFGGEGNETSNELIISGEFVYIGGQTNSEGLSIKNPWQSKHGGGEDGFYAKYSVHTGGLVEASYIGGLKNDYINGMDYEEGALYLTGYTENPGLAEGKAHDKVLNGLSDAFYFKKPDSGENVLAGFFGGDGVEAGYAASALAKGDLILFGYTESPEGISAPGAIQEEYAGEGDCFIARFNPIKDDIYEMAAQVIGYEFCAGVVIPITIETNIEFPEGNKFIVELSGPGGSFNPLLNSRIYEKRNSFDIEFPIPGDVPNGSKYKIRIKSTGAGISSIEPDGGFAIINLSKYGISGEKTVCEYSNNIEYEVELIDEAHYEWAIQGGEIVSGQGMNKIKVNWHGEGSGTAKLVITKGDCIHDTNYAVQVKPKPEASLEQYPDICEYEEPFKLYGGEPSGGSYFINGKLAETFDPKSGKKGKNIIEYNYENEFGCAATAEISFNVIERPQKPVIIYNSGLLVSSSAEQNIWYFNGEVIEGAGGKEYEPEKYGKYSVKAVNSAGCESELSEPFNYEAPKKAEISAPGQIEFPNLICEKISKKTISIENTGNATLLIKSAEIAGQDFSDFELPDNLNGLEIPPGSEKIVEILFKPETAGMKNAFIIIISNAEEGAEFKIELSAAYLPVEFSLEKGELIFDGLEPDDSKVKEIEISNTGLVPINFKYSLESAFFDILSIKPEKTQPGESAIARIKFLGGEAGSYSALAYFKDHECGKSIGLNLIAEVAEPEWKYDTVTIKPADVDANSGDTAEIEILISGVKKIYETNAGSIYTEIETNATLLAPLDSESAGEIINGKRITALEIPLTGEDEISKKISFLVTLGNDSTSPIRIKNTTIAGFNGSFNEGEGILRLLNLCTEGGPRYVYTGPASTLSISPNPASAKANVNFELIENGLVEISAFNYAGELIKVIHTGNLQKGVYTVETDLSGLSAGSYFVIMKTPTIYKSSILNIVR